MKNIGVYSQYRVRFGEIRFSVDMQHSTSHGYVYGIDDLAMLHRQFARSDQLV
jgi:hypothetical protein